MRRFFGPNRGNCFTTSPPKFLREGCFHFFSKNRPEKHQKRAILHTFQANGGSSSTPRPPGYATARNQDFAKGRRGLKLKVKKCKCLNWETCCRDGADNKICIRMLRCVRKPCPHAAPHRIQTQLSSRCTALHRKLNIL